MSTERIARIEQRLRAVFDPATIEIVDDSAAHAGHAGAASGAGHFNVLIIAPVFMDKSRLERHRMVYGALQDMMQKDIHALGIKALAPAEQR